MWIGQQARVLGQEIPIALVVAPHHGATTWTTGVNAVISSSGGRSAGGGSSGSTPGANVPMAQRVTPGGPTSYPVPCVDREPMNEARLTEDNDDAASFGIGRGRPAAAQNDACGQCFGWVALLVIVSGCLFGLQGVLFALLFVLACIAIAVRTYCP